MGLFDHLLTLLIVIAAPWSAIVQLPVILREIERGNTALRGRVYLTVAAQQTLFGVLLLAYWWLAGRPYAALGLRVELGKDFPAASLSVGVFAALWIGAHLLLVSRAGGRKWLRCRAGRLLTFLPHTVQERNRFLVLSLSAGTGEEMFFRGFLLWYVNFYLGLWPAVFVSSLIFALVHLYQGWRNATLVAFLGVLFALSYVWTGSLWLAIFLHVIVDVNAAFVGLRLNLAHEREAHPA